MQASYVLRIRTISRADGLHVGFLKAFFRTALRFGTVLKAHLSHQFSHGFLNIFLEPGTGCGWEGSSRYGSKEQKTERRE